MIDQDSTGLADDSRPLADRLRAYTKARVGLKRTGVSITTRELLQFQMDFAKARDAVHNEIDEEEMLKRLRSVDSRALLVYSAADSLQTFLQRPDLGRQLHPDSMQRLQNLSGLSSGSVDLCIILSGGLSAGALEQAFPLFERLLPALQANGLSLAPLILAHRARVALGDPIGFLLRAKISLVLIGERPGMSSNSSLGAYLTYDPRPGKTDESRNCLSNIREGGLSADQAAFTLHWLIREAGKRRMSGVLLKDESGRESSLSDDI